VNFRHSSGVNTSIGPAGRRQRRAGLTDTEPAGLVAQILQAERAAATPAVAAAGSQRR